VTYHGAQRAASTIGATGRAGEKDFSGDAARESRRESAPPGGIHELPGHSKGVMPYRGGRLTDPLHTCGPCGTAVNSQESNEGVIGHAR
jgi:hypothetical protein